MSIGIYGIFSNKNDCLYIGQSVQIETRFKRHLSKLRNGTHRKEFVSWFSVNGGDSLVFKILEYCVVEDLNIKEIHYFNEHSPMFFGKQPSKGDSFKVSDSTKKKISDTLSNEPKELTCHFCKEKYFSKRNTKYCSISCGSTRVSADDINTMILLHKSGFSLSYIGSQIGVSKVAVRARLIKLGKYYK